LRRQYEERIVLHGGFVAMLTPDDENEWREHLLENVPQFEQWMHLRTELDMLKHSQGPEVVGEIQVIKNNMEEATQILNRTIAIERIFFEEAKVWCSRLEQRKEKADAEAKEERRIKRREELKKEAVDLEEKILDFVPDDG